MNSIIDDYGRGGWVYMGDKAKRESFKSDPTISYFKDGIEDVAHLYPVIQSCESDIRNLPKCENR